MKPAKPDHKRVTRFAIWGAIALGLSGFVSGVSICLYFQLPIPPLFITELGALVGGCLGALCALTGNEKRATFAFLSLVLSTPLCLLMGVDVRTSAIGILALAIAAWTLAESAPTEERAWRNI